MKPKYDVDYFIAKFKAIPDELWTTGTYTRMAMRDGQPFQQHCALGHCGATDCGFSRFTEEANALLALVPGVASINDVRDVRYPFGGGTAAPSYLQTTPKARVLAALEDIRQEQRADDSCQGDQSPVSAPEPDEPIDNW